MVSQSNVAVLSSRKMYERIFEHVLSAKCKNVQILGELFSFHWFGCHPRNAASFHNSVCSSLSLSVSLSLSPSMSSVSSSFSAQTCLFGDRLDHSRPIGIYI